MLKNNIEIMRKRCAEYKKRFMLAMSARFVVGGLRHRCPVTGSLNFQPSTNLPIQRIESGMKLAGSDKARRSAGRNLTQGDVAVRP